MMIYFNDENLVIESMEESDIDLFYSAFQNQGWHKEIETLKKYFREQESGVRQVFVARKKGHIAGYITLKKATKGPFIGEYEAQDFNVFIPYQHQKIGYRLLCTVEEYVFQRANCITLAVGLHQGYGKAQKLYIRNGYIPDGSGVFYRGKVLEPYTSCMNDDDLILYLKKERDN